MDYKKLAADLLSGCEENCADCEYAGDSEFECTIAQLAATAITDLLAENQTLRNTASEFKARAEAAEARAEKAERERDAYKEMIYKERPCFFCTEYTGEWNPECIKCDRSTKEYRPQFRLREQKEE